MALIQVLGGRTRRAPSLGLTSVTEDWKLSGAEIKDLTTIHAQIAIQELKVEQRRGNLKPANRFVDGKQFKLETQVRLGGNITYDEVGSLEEVMLFITLQLWAENAKFRDTGRLQESVTWRWNGTEVRPNGVPILDARDQLVVYPENVRYAKYQESGTIKNSAKWVYRKVARRAQRRFGKAFVFKHAFIQDREIPTKLLNVRIPRIVRGKPIVVNKYYDERWKASYPAIKIQQRSGVGFRVQ